MASPAANAPFFLVRTELVLSRSRQSGGGAGEECTCTKASTATEHRNPPVNAMPLMCLNWLLFVCGGRQKHSWCRIGENIAQKAQKAKSGPPR